MYASNGPATLVGGEQNNFLEAGTAATRTLGQSLVGGKSTNSLYGNTLRGGAGRDTLRSGAGFSTLISGSNSGVTSTINAATSIGVTSISVANASGLAVGQQITGNGIASGTTITAIAGTKLSLSAKTTAPLSAGTRINTVGNILIGQGLSNNLRARSGNDSLAAVSGNSTLLGGVGLTTLQGGTAGSNNLLQSGYTLAGGAGGNTLIGGAGSNTLVAGTTGSDSIVGGANQNLLLVTQANRNSISNDTIRLSTLASAKNTLGVSLNAGTSFVDNLISGTFRGTAKNLSRVENIGNVAARIELGSNAEAVGVRTLASGTTNDTLSAAGYQNASILIDGSRASSRASMVGGTRNDTLIGSRGGADTLIGGAGNDLLSLQNANISLMSLDGGAGTTDTLRFNTASLTLQGASFSKIKNIENLALSSGSNLVGSLQGSGINNILGGSGSDTLSANLVATVKTRTSANSKTLSLSMPAGVTDAMGFASGQVISGNGIRLGTRISNIVVNGTSSSRTITLTLDTATSTAIASGSVITGFLNKATLNGGTNTNGKGDYLLSGGLENLLIGSQNSNNTLVSGVYSSNTLSGGSGRNLYILNNKVGWNNTLAGENLPWILNRSGIQSASTLQFTGDAIKLSDKAFAKIDSGAAQVIRTANGNNRIQIGELARPIGIQTIIGGIGSDTFTAPIDYLPSVYFDSSRGSGNQSLSAGLGDDTLLAGTGNATLEGGDGNNSLRGGLGNNSIHSGVGNSTLDGGLGISTLQAEGGDNLFVVRNRFTRILGPTTDSDGNVISETPLVGTVNTYVNFDPIQSTQVDQFAPTLPDGSPSITKSPSFASRDLSSFYNLQYFNLLGTANYGVGNALDNTISAAVANALILGMGGNNTLVAAGANSSLYGNIPENYSNPDLYAYAPFDTKIQEFVDGVIGIAGDNSLVANGANSFLDGGEGYNDGNFGSGSNTLIGNGGNSTLVQRHQSDVLVSGGTGTVFTSVDLYRLPDNVSDVVVVVTPQATNSGQITEDGQRMTAGYVAVNDATGGYTRSHGVKIGDAPNITVANSVRMQVLYGSSDGTTYGADGDLALEVSDVSPDPKDPANKNSVSLSWSVPTTPDGDLKAQTLGYLVKYRCLDADGNPVSPWLTYLSGSSQDLQGTSENPRLLVDNLPTSSAGKSVSSYDFQVIAQETVLPAVTDMDPASPTFAQLIARPVSLIGGDGSEVIFGDVLDTTGKSYSNTRAVLNNNPVDPADPGAIATPAPWSPTARFSGLFSTYQDGKGGNDYLISPFINNGSGANFTAWQNIGGAPIPVTFSGINTLVGGTGSDTFVVSNGGTDLNVVNGVVQTSAYDQIIKYGLETPTGQNNLVISAVDYLTLSDTDVSQGKFINQAWAANGGQYVAGNRLDNTLVGYGSNNTLLGALGRDSIFSADSGDYLLGGTAYGLDSIGGALNDFRAVSLGGNGYSASIYRDTDPVPVMTNGPGSADNSQYWMVNGPFGPVNDRLRNSDTLVSGVDGDDSLRNIGGAVMDGGAGYDSMKGGTGNDTLYVSSINSFDTLAGTGSNGNASMSLTGAGFGGDVVVGGGGNDWIILTGSDVYWSGRTGATTAVLGYALSNDGDAIGDQSISNIKLQDGSPVARRATGNATSTGNQQKSKLGNELGSNQIIGNEQANTLNGGGVGGVLGNGIGVDTLTGGAGADRFVIGANYRNSDLNSTAATSVTSVLLNATTSRIIYSVAPNGNATDADYAIITDFNNGGTAATNLERLQLTGSASNYAIGAAPSSFGENNIRSSGSVDRNQFGIYDITSAPNLVAVVNTAQDISLGGFINIAGKNVDGSSSNFGGGSFTWDTNQSDVLRTTGLDYLGVGPMYQLQGSNFRDHVSFS
jgi:Ca2+-binding RTX toxin-like protein